LSNTRRAYCKEAERFWLWAIMHKGKALSSMSDEDCIEYRDFLADPQPRSRWCGDRGREGWSPLWRPFEGPLSASAHRYAVSILKDLYGLLVDQNYLMGTRGPRSACREQRRRRGMRDGVSAWRNGRSSNGNSRCWPARRRIGD